MIRLSWTHNGWRVSGFNMSFIVENYVKAFFFVKYQADIDVNFMVDYLLND
jgi:hypothetical protein